MNVGRNAHNQILRGTISQLKTLLTTFKPYTLAKNKHLEITIYATKKGNEILFTVSDNGGGVKQEDINKIFEPLYTTDPGRKIPGLGLSICKQIVELHGGNIEAKNNINKGLSISFALKRRLI